MIGRLHGMSARHRDRVRTWPLIARLRNLAVLSEFGATVLAFWECESRSVKPGFGWTLAASLKGGEHNNTRQEMGDAARARGR